TRFSRDWSSDVCSSDLADGVAGFVIAVAELVRADLLAAFANGEQGADRGAVPPGEDLAQHVVELTRIHRPGEVRRRKGDHRNREVGRASGRERVGAAGS